MAFDGAGNYSLPPGSIVSDGTTIDAADHNIPVNDIAAALSQLLLRSGVAPMTGDLNMGGFSIVGVGGTSPGLGTDNTWTGANTWSGANIMTTVGSTGVPLELISTNDDSSIGPILSLYRNPVTVASGDTGGGVYFYGRDSNGNKTPYATISVRFADVTDASEDGALIFATPVAGSFGNRFIIGAGIYHPSATGGDKGSNTINYGAIYHNGVLVPKTDAANTWTAAQSFNPPLNNTVAQYLNRVNPSLTPLSYYNLKNVTGGVSSQAWTWFIALDTYVVGSIGSTYDAGTATGETSYNTTSDGRLKPEEYRRQIDDCGDIIDRLNPVYFRWQGPGAEPGEAEDYGFIAQEVYEILPRAVTKGDDGPLRKGLPDQGGSTPWMMERGRMEPLLVAEVKALRARVASLEARLEALEAR